MSKIIELAKKLKKLSEQGVGGEKINAEKMLSNLLIKNKLSIEDIEGEKIDNYFFEIKDRFDKKLLVQIVGCVKYGLKVHGEIPLKDVKKYKFEGNFFVQCTASEFIEIKSKLEFYSTFYKKEVDIFFIAFIKANDLLISPPIGEQLKDSEMSESELDEWERTEIMSKSIKKGSFIKQIQNADFAN